jgi:hypothetical protein
MDLSNTFSFAPDEPGVRKEYLSVVARLELPVAGVDATLLLVLTLCKGVTWFD